MLDTLALEYIVPLYVMVLIVASYIFIELHDKSRVQATGCSIWKPFAVCFHRFRQQWNHRHYIGI